MIKRVFYFIISCLLLFFSSSINPKMEFDGFYDKNQAIYMIHSNDVTESYSFIELNKVQIFARNIIRAGTPKNSVEIKPIIERFIEYEEYSPILYEGGYYTILTRYESRILRI